MIGKRQDRKVCWLLLAAFTKMFLERYVTKYKKNWRMSRDQKSLRIGKATVLDSLLESAKYGGKKVEQSSVKIR